MRKLLLSAILLSGALACHAQEQANIVATFYYDEGIPGIVWGISDNGQWAVGYDDMVAYNAFYWNREEQKFVDVFGLDENGEMAEGYAAALYDVSDNGLAVGKFEDGRTGYTYPGIFDCTQNTWTALPTLVEINNAAYAQAITPDGGLIAGSASAEIVTSDALPGSTIKTGGPKVPVIWRNNQIERYDEAEYVGQGAWINDMNADGSMLCGYAEWDDGSRSPVVWKDGKMVRLIGTEPAVENPDIWDEFYEGQMYCFNADATMAGGYFSEGMYGSTYGIVWDIPETFSQEAAGEVEEVNTLLAAGGKDGKFFGGGMSGGSAMVYDNGQVSSFLNYYNITDNPKVPASINAVSSDETLFGTSCVYTVAGMGSVQCPMVICLDKENDSSINAATGKETIISYANNTINVAGTCCELSVYNMGGQRLMQADATNGSLDLTSLGSGIYLVKVQGSNYTQIRKIVVE